MKGLRFFALVLGFTPLVAVAALSSDNGNTNCLEQSKVDQMFEQFEIMKTSARVNVDLCDSGSAAHALLRGLIFIKDLGAIHSDKTPFNSNWIGGEPYEFFRSRVKKIVLDDSSDCNGLSQIWPSERPQKIVRVCMKASKYDTLTVAEGLIHEARHLETREFAHAVCHDGEMRGKESCDTSYEMGGAYAVGVEFLIKIHQTERLDANVREQARAMAAKALRERFNISPFTMRTDIEVSSRKKENGGESSAVLAL